MSIQCLNMIKSAWRESNRWHRVLLLLLIVELKIIPSRQHGFYCSDPALSYPFTGDTITFKWLLGVCLLLPLVILLITERVYSTDKKNSKDTAIKWYKQYLFGFLVNLTITESLKLLVGSPRPHFFDTCQPKEASSCQGSEYISSYTCSKAHWLKQSDRSFPSGHTSLALHAGLFIAYYLHRRSEPTHSINIRTVQALSVVSAAACGASRLWDRRHHWWDVLAGAGVAVVSLLYTIYILCENFECTAKEDTTKLNSEDTSTTIMKEKSNELLTTVHKTQN